ncbi:hypothetical protein EfmJHP10_13890 [Enterococcus faecium]|nr:hypothetical protein EfmJHP10_13890 [Enterococcus faecium]
MRLLSYYIVAANFFGFIFSSKLLVVLSGDIGVNICHLSVMRIQEFVSIKNCFSLEEIAHVDKMNKQDYTFHESNK